MRVSLERERWINMERVTLKHLVQRYNPSTKGYYFVGIPATYEITVEYDGKPYIISDANAYDKYANKIGTDATGVLRIRKYDDGSVKKDIIGVK